jgi:hypothetical protein
MINTLRITSVVAAILAGVFFVFPVIYGVRSDERIDEFLKLPSLKEKFEEVADNKTKAGDNRVSPLVEQAEAFALFLNPAKPAVRKTAKGTRPSGIANKVAVTPKFKVFATSYCPENPELSQALIDEPGRGRYWVRQSSMVGHLLVEQVKDGIVVVKGSKETFELPIEKESGTATPVRMPSASSARNRSRLTPTSPASGRSNTNVRRPTSIPQKPQRNIKDDEKMGQLVNKLKDLQQNSASDKTDSGIDTEERSARIQELISKFKSTRVSAEESKKLGNMGEELKSSRKDPNSSPPVSGKGKGKVSPPKPGASAEK